MSACGRCGAAIVWVRTPAGKAMPCDARPVYIVEEEGGPEKAVIKGGQVVSCRFTDDPDQAIEAWNARIREKKEGQP